MYLSVSSASTASGPQVSHFMRLNRQNGQLSSLLADELPPPALLPRIHQPWPSQLGADLAEPIEQLLRRGQAACLPLELESESWLLEFVPELDPYWLICARRLLSNENRSSSRGLALLELEKQAAQPASLARNRQILERLQLMLGCDRLILWSQQPDRLHPVFMLGSGSLPATQSLELRYQKALRSRGILGFSNLAHQPMLQSQEYLQQEGILARLDVQLKFNGQPCGLLTLEYRSIQESFPPLSFHLAEKAAQLLMLPESLACDPLALTWLPEFNQTHVWRRDDAYWLALSQLLSDQGHAALIMIFQYAPHSQHWHHLLTIDRGSRYPTHPSPLCSRTLQSLLPMPAHQLSADELRDLGDLNPAKEQGTGYWYPVLNDKAEVVGAMVLGLYLCELARLEQVLALTHYRTQAELTRPQLQTRREESEATEEIGAQLTQLPLGLDADAADEPTLVQQSNLDAPSATTTLGAETEEA